ncbi:hypothetical protein [Brucella sp. IR073]|uniref:hypothetical protein n=1 Tax=Brucella sp. IR073 TaxID=3121517 RepID=UPI003B984AB0
MAWEDITIETLAETAPTGQNVQLWASMARVGGDVITDYTNYIIWTSNYDNATPPVQYIDGHRATFKDEATTLIGVTVFVPNELSGETIEFRAAREKKTGMTGTPAPLPLYFMPFDDGITHWGGVAITAVSAKLETPRNVIYGNSPTIAVTARVTSALGPGIPQTEIQWYTPVPGEHDLQLYKDQAGTDLNPGVPRDRSSGTQAQWYATRTDGDGYSTVYIQYDRTTAVTVGVRALGDKTTTDNDTVFFVDPYDTTVDDSINSLQINLQNGIYTLSGPDVVFRLPDGVPPIYISATTQAWLYIDNLVSDTPVVARYWDKTDAWFPGIPLTASASDFYVSSPGEKDTNLAFLFFQTVAGEVGRTLPIQFGVQPAPHL